MKKYLSALLSFSLILCLFTSCEGGSQTSSTPISSSEAAVSSEIATDIEDSFPDETNSVGNTPSNLSNGGYFSRQGTKLYFRNEDMDGKLTCMGTDCTSPKIMTSEVTRVNNINVVGDSIYFSCEAGGIYTVKADKSGFKKLIDTDCTYLVATADKLIYASVKDNLTTVYASDTDGQNPIKLKSLSGLTGDFAFENNRLYYSFNKSESVKDYICYISPDGSETGSAYSSYCESFTLLNSHLYVYNDGTLTIFPLSDSAEAEVINNVNIDSMNTDGTDLYYTDKATGNIFKVIIKTGEVSQLNKEASSHLSLIGQHIFYSQISSVNPSGFCHWRMRTDGSFDAKRVFAIF